MNHRSAAWVFDVNGRRIRTLEDRSRQAEDYVARWDGQTDSGTAAASGTYFARIAYPEGSAAERKMTILRLGSVGSPPPSGH